MKFFSPPVLPVLSATPAEGETGAAYIDENSGKVILFNGTEWVTLVDEKTFFVGQDNPNLNQPGLWIETDENEDIVTFWVETGGA